MNNQRGAVAIKKGLIEIATLAAQICGEFGMAGLICHQVDEIAQMCTPWVHCAVLVKSGIEVRTGTGKARAFAFGDSMQVNTMLPGS